VSASNDGTSAAAKAKSPRLAKSHTERADRPAVGSKSGGPPPGTGAGTKLNLRKLNEDLVAENADLQKKLSHMKSKTESLAKLQSRFSDSEKKRKRADEENAFVACFICVYKRIYLTGWYNFILLHNRCPQKLKGRASQTQSRE
jgi:hypothetical protein